jgi:hypothetical protein
MDGRFATVEGLCVVPRPELQQLEQDTPVARLPRLDLEPDAGSLSAWRTLHDPQWHSLPECKPTLRYLQHLCRWCSAPHVLHPVCAVTLVLVVLSTT